MDEESKPFTAFMLGPPETFECNHMLICLANAPETFQCLMDPCLGDLHLNWYIIYLDYIIVFADSPETHLERLRAVFEKLKLKDSSLSQEYVSSLRSLRNLVNVVS